VGFFIEDGIPFVSKPVKQYETLGFGMHPFFNGWWKGQ
jgi:hypothetical protein